MTSELWPHARTWEESYAGYFLSVVVRPSVDVDELYSIDSDYMDRFAPGTPAAKLLVSEEDPETAWSRLNELEPAFCRAMFEAVFKPITLRMAEQLVDAFCDEVGYRQAITH